MKLCQYVLKKNKCCSMRNDESFFLWRTSSPAMAGDASSDDCCRNRPLIYLQFVFVLIPRHYRVCFVVDQNLIIKCNRKII